MKKLKTQDRITKYDQIQGADGKQYRKLTFVIDLDDHGKIKAKAALQNIPMAELIRRIIKEAVKK